MKEIGEYKETKCDEPESHNYKKEQTVTPKMVGVSKSSVCHVAEFPTSEISVIE